jgi:hypothetical protein
MAMSVEQCGCLMTFAPVRCLARVSGETAADNFTDGGDDFARVPIVAGVCHRRHETKPRALPLQA